MYFSCSNKQYVNITDIKEFAAYDVDITTYTNNHGLVIRKDIYFLPIDLKEFTLEEMKQPDKIVIPTEYGYLWTNKDLECQANYLVNHFLKHRKQGNKIPKLKALSASERFAMKKLSPDYKTKDLLRRGTNYFNAAVIIMAWYLFFFVFYCSVFDEDSFCGCCIARWGIIICLALCMTIVNVPWIIGAIEVEEKYNV